MTAPARPPASPSLPVGASHHVVLAALAAAERPRPRRARGSARVLRRLHLGRRASAAGA